MLRNRFGGALGDDSAAAVAALRSQVDDPVRGLDHIEVVLDDDDRIALVAQSVQHVQQLTNVLEVQSRGGLVENVKRLASVALGKFARQFDALSLAAGKGGGALAETDVGQSDIHQGLQLSRQHGHRVEELARFLYGHIQNFLDVPALVAHVECFPVVALAPADIAGDVDVGQEVHFDLDDAVPPARLATTALDVETEPSGPIAAGAGFVRLREQLPHGREDTRVRGRVRTGRAADGALVDVHDLVEAFESFDRGVGAGRPAARAVEALRRDRVERLVDQRGLPGTRDAGNAGEESRRDVHRYLFQVVACGTYQADSALPVHRHASARHLDTLLAGQVLAGKRCLGRLDTLQRPRSDDFAAVDTRARADIDDVVRRANRFFIVFHHQYSVAEVAQVGEGAQQAGVVALVQAYGGFIQDIQDADQAGADLACQADALRLSSRERLRAAVERQVVQSHVDEKSQPGAYFLDDLVGDGAALASQFQTREIRQSVFDGVGCDLGDRRAIDVHVAGFLAQARAATRGTRTHAQILAETLAHHRGLCFPITALHVGNHALESMPPSNPVAAIIEIAEIDALIARAVQDGVPLFLP